MNYLSPLSLTQRSSSRSVFIAVNKSLLFESKCFISCSHQQQQSNLNGNAQATVTTPSKPLPSAYDPQLIEKDWYSWWEAKGLFKPVSKNDKVFSMVLPPPNVTGSLHIGHALTNSVEDAIARWRRMCGDGVQWIPGTDHAGIATQAVVEKKLLKEQNKSRLEIGRDPFVKLVWEWKEKYGNRIYEQLRRQGASLNWEADVFTLDEKRSKAVTEAFVKLYEAGLVYRDTRLVNWSCKLETAISDIEVDTITTTGRKLLSFPWKAQKAEIGVMHFFAYKLSDNPAEEIVVGTTRLETLFGDVAVAVHPEDSRYSKYIGKSVIHPFNGRKLVVIGDSILVDPSIGTGAVKITPAHDFNDYECAKRNHLPMISIFSSTGLLNENVPDPYKGMDRHAARQSLVSVLQQLGLYRETKPHPMTVSICSRSGDLLEPMVLPQWFVKSAPLAERAQKMIEGDTPEIMMQPALYRKEWTKWMSNIHDWCISRQLWWGHRIPAYKLIIEGGHVQSSSNSKDNDNDNNNNNSNNNNNNDHSQKHLSLNENFTWIVARTEKEAYEKAEIFLRNQQQKQQESSITTPLPKFHLEQDPDVLDTWFSSGLFPLSVWDWPDSSWTNNAKFYPLSLMETGGDILFFWVARMAMLCSFLEPSAGAPFKSVLLHPMVRDSQGRKMSKSLGNVIDPLHVINGVTKQEMINEIRSSSNLASTEIDRAVKGIETEFPKGIPASGADSLRFALLSYLEPSVQFINMDIKRVTHSRHICNKLLNAVKFAQLNHSSLQQEKSQEKSQESANEESLSLSSRISGSSSAALSIADKWILTKLLEAVSACNESLEMYHFAKYTQTLQKFIWQELCDVYVEFCKPIFYKGGQSGNELNSNNGDDSSSSSSSSSVSAIDILEEKRTTLAVLTLCLEVALRLAHPVMPFITEELWQYLGANKLIKPEQISIMVSDYPKTEDFTALLESQGIIVNSTAATQKASTTISAIDREMTLMLETIKACRYVRQVNDISGGVKIDVIIRHSQQYFADFLQSNVMFLKRFANLNSVSVICDSSSSSSASSSSLTLSKTIFEGFVSKVVDSECVVYVNVAKVLPKEMIEKVIEKLLASQSNSKSTLSKLVSRMESKFYKEASDSQKEKDSVQRASLELEINELQSTINDLQSITKN